MSTAAAPRTIGVAIALPEPIAETLRQLRRDAGDPQADLVPPHVTFLPPSVVPGAALGEIERHLASVAAAHRPFTLHLAGAGSFRPVSQVVFAQVSEGIGQCELIAADVCTGPLDYEPSFPYHPHVTIAHGVTAEQLDRSYDSLGDFDAVLDVVEFTMFEQTTQGTWTTRRSFPLGGAGAVAGTSAWAEPSAGPNRINARTRAEETVWESARESRPKPRKGLG